MIESRWLLDIEIDGQTRRYAEDYTEVGTAGGETLFYFSGLGSDLELAPGDAVEIEIVDPDVNWPALALQVEQTPVLLRRWVEGTDLEQARTYARGLAAGVNYGTREEAVTFGVVPRTTGDKPFPDPQAQVSLDTWPITTSPTHNVPEDQVGAWYPRLFGSPGAHPGFTGSGQRTPMPVPICQYRAATISTTYALISDRPLPNLSALTLLNPEAAYGVAASVTATPAVVADLLGRKVTVASLDTFEALPGAAGSNFALYVGFAAGEGGEFRGAWDCLASLLREFAVDSVDWDRMYDTRDLLNGYQCDTWISGPQAGPWDWFESQLLPFLPVRIVEGVRGKYLERVRWWAPPSDAIRSLSAERNECSRDGGITFARGAVFNEFTLNYRQDWSKNWLDHIIVSGGASRPGLVYATNTRTLTHPLATASFVRYGLRAADPIDLDWTWDESTAIRVLEDLVEAQALPPRMATYLVPDGEDLRTGDVVLLTDEDVALEDQVAIVDEPPTVGPDGAGVVFRLVEVP